MSLKCQQFVNADLNRSVFRLFSVEVVDEAGEFCIFFVKKR